MRQTRRGGTNCFAVGCIAAAVIGVLVIVLVYAGTRWLKQQAAGYLAAEAAELPVCSPAQDEIDAVNGKFEKAFVELLEGEPTELIVTARDLNVLVASQPEMSNHQGRVYFEITNDTFAVRVALPLDQVDSTFMKGKWLNGEARVGLAVADNRLEAYVREIRVNTKPLPEFFMSELRAVNMLEGAREEMSLEVREVFDRLESVEIRDNELKLRTTAGPDYLAEQPLDIAPPELPADKKAVLYEEIGTFHAASTAGEAAELRLDRDELNLLIDAMELAVTNRAERPLVEADIAEGTVRLRGSAPLAATGITSLTNKFLNGDANLRLEILGGKLSGRLVGTRINGNALPAFLKQILAEVDFFSNLEMDEENTDPEIRRLVEAVSGVRVQDGHLVFFTVTPTNTPTRSAEGTTP